ncbi:MAG: hypothetical protein JO267_07030 [Alphaproteobacteria bacterium]|nr:hypothetical protein [Alphaproteobacteria bacterium]
MTLAEAGEIFRYWERHPPVHLLLAAVLGVRSRRSGPAPSADALPPGLARAGDAALGMPQPVFDVEELRRRNRARALGSARGSQSPVAAS